MAARSIALIGGLLVVLAPIGIRDAPNFSVPFPCGETWTGSTRTAHHPPQAVDFNRPGDDGDVVVASEAGRVSRIDPAHVSYGGLVVIEHGDGWETYSAHLGTIAVAEGDVVRRGDPIGTVGDTGRSEGAHLHYEQRLHGRPMRTVFRARETPSQATLPFRAPSC